MADDNQNNQPLSPWPLMPLDARVLGGLRSRISQYSDLKGVTLVPRKTMRWERDEVAPIQPLQAPFCPGSDKCMDISGIVRPCDSSDAGPHRVRTACDGCCQELIALGVGEFASMTSCQITTCCGGNTTSKFFFAQRVFKASFLSTFPSSPSYPCGSCCDLYLVQRIK